MGYTGAVFERFFGSPLGIGLSAGALIVWWAAPSWRPTAASAARTSEADRLSPLVRRFLKTAILFLLFGIGLGVYMLVRRELDGAWPSPWWISAHTHALLVGFVMIMILGVAPVDVTQAGQRRSALRSASRRGGLLAAGQIGPAARVGGEMMRPMTASRQGFAG